MPQTDNPVNWYLKKHENGEVFGPIHLSKIQEWARSAHVNPQDMLSPDGTVWTKAPMVADMKMDWLVVVGEDLLYGPTTAGALIEFYRMEEVTPDTLLINSCTGDWVALRDTAFFQEAMAAPKEEEVPSGTLFDKLDLPTKGNIRFNLQKRVRELESSLLDKRRRLLTAEETIAKMEVRIKELEDRIKDFSGLRAKN